MSELETPPWHQCKSESELRHEIAKEVIDMMSDRSKQMREAGETNASMHYSMALVDCTKVILGKSA
jgi:hypothetical protein